MTELQDDTTFPRKINYLSSLYILADNKEQCVSL